ncbi:MAG TPA: DUF4258 domain-containing protein [Acetobacteraceae bacterium]|nr:DUF4258 domain-containing protein [Acetobacteraceae bacterium]
MIRLTKHVERRIQKRHLALAWIEATIAAPDWTAQDPDPTLTRSYKAIAAFGGHVLRVVHRPEGADILVVTAFFDRDAKR